jgi:hypothetical protein
MFNDLMTLLELRSDPTRIKQRPVSTLAFDWLYVALTLLFTLGVALDLWSHGRYGPDQSVLSEYHMLFYSAIATMGLLLLGLHLLNVRAGIPWTDSLPVGYGLSFVGIVLFGTAGVFDLIGHALWGFEVGIEALYSPSHFGLFIAGMLIRVGPIRAMLARHKHGEQPRLLHMIPGLICLTAFIAACSASVIGYGPLGGTPFALQSNRQISDNVGIMLGVAGAFIQTALIFGALLWLMRRVRLPFGSFTLVFLCIGLLTLVRQGPLTLAVSLIAGVLIDVFASILSRRLPTPTWLWVFSFGAPVILWLSFYGFIILTNYNGGTYYTVYVWFGSTIQCGLIGLGLNFLLSSTSKLSSKEHTL